VTGLGETVAEAIAKAYQAVDKISWEGAYCRRDIGRKALTRLSQPPRWALSWQRLGPGRNGGGRGHVEEFGVRFEMTGRLRPPQPGAGHEICGRRPGAGH